MSPHLARLARPCLAAAILVAPWSAGAQGTAVKPPQGFTWPPETSRLVEAPGVDAARTYCLVCHSADYVSTQPPHMPPAFWEAEVTKMRKAYGAPIPDDKVKTIVDYLNAAYGAGPASKPAAP